MALVGGLYAPPGRIMGHAGAWTAVGEPGPKAKYQALERAGAVMVNHPEKFGEGMKMLLAGRSRTIGATTANTAGQKRGMHTMRRVTPRNREGMFPQHQTRSLFIKPFQALDMLKQKSIPIREGATSESDVFLNLTVDRTTLSPCILASSTADFSPSSTGRFPFPYTTTDFIAGETQVVDAVASHLQLGASSRERLAGLVQALWEIFKEKEAYLLEVRVNPSDGALAVCGARFGFDDAAFRSSGRQEEVHRLRNTAEEVREEVEAEKDGIVYVKYVPL